MNILRDEFVAVDLETTGLDCNKNRIIEVGAVKVRGGEIVERFSSFVACPVPLPWEITELTGIEDGDLAGAPDLKEVLQQLVEFLGNAVLVGHNLSFDYGFLKVNGSRYGITFNAEQVDTLRLARTLLRGKVNNFKLSTLAEYFGITFRHHRALDDAEATAKILLALANSAAA